MSDDARESEPGSGYVRLPAALVAVAILVVLAAALAVGIYANNNLRQPRLEIATPPATAPLIATVATTSTPQPTPVPTATPASADQPTAVVTAGRTVLVPTAAPFTATPAATQPATPLPTVEPTLAAEVGQAYENYWRVRSQALLELDATHLPDVIDGDYLSAFENNLQQLASEGKAIKTEVTLNYRVLQADDNSATVVDRIEDDSYYVRAGTDEPISSPANDLLRLEVKLRQREGVWRVVESVSAD